MDPALALARRTERADVEHVGAARPHSCKGRLSITRQHGTSRQRIEVAAQLPFPVEFTEAPHFSFGWSILPGSPLVEGQYPILSAAIDESRWETKVRGITRHYTGATVLCVIEALPRTEVVLMWEAAGMGIL